MDVYFKSERLMVACNEKQKGIRAYGDRRFRLIRRRLDDLTAALRLSDMRGIGNCHELKGDRKGQLAVDLDKGWRLLFVPAQDPAPIKPDGGLDWSKVTSVSIVDVEDYQ
ncbi:MAG: killer suppression protein [Candidatus Zixiibacteriota bacterium]